MRSWLLTLGGLLVWAAHFFAVYIAGSLFPGTRTARWLTIGLTIIALGAILIFIYRIYRRRQLSDGSGRWLDTLALLGAGLAGIAILYQTMPAFIV